MVTNPHEVIRIRMEAYDHLVLDQSAKEIVETANSVADPDRALHGAVGTEY